MAPPLALIQVTAVGQKQRPPGAARKQPTTGTCIFCQAVGPLEREHVLAAWIRNQSGIIGLRRHRVIKGLNLQIAHSWSNPIATATVRCVCYGCNHGWMKALEERVMGTIGGMMRNGLTIVPVGGVLRDLAAWAYKTAAVAQELPRNTLKPIAAGSRGYVYAKGEPPPNTTVWLSPTPDPGFFDAVIYLASLGEGTSEWGYLAQTVIGRVRLAIIGSFTGRALPFKPSDVLGVNAIEIWPTHPGVLRQR